MAARVGRPESSHSRDLVNDRGLPAPDTYVWAIEYEERYVGGARLHVDADQTCATYAVGLFVPARRGRGLGREATRLVVGWRSMCWACTASSWKYWPAIDAR